MYYKVSIRNHITHVRVLLVRVAVHARSLPQYTCKRIHARYVAHK